MTPKGWVELANPSSTKISLRLFSLNNCSSKVSSCKSSSEDSLLNFLEIREFQLALRTLHNEAAFVAPWNFLRLRISLSTASSVARILMAWTSLRSSSPSSWTMPWSPTPHVGETARFPSYGELKSTWQAFFSVRPQSALSKKMNASIRNKPSRQGQAQNSSGTKKKCPFIDVCYNFNKGICQKTAGQCTSASGIPLRLICDHRPDPNNLMIFCGQNHRRIDNH